MSRILLLASTSLLACSIHAAHQPLSLPAQVILGGGNDNQDLRLPLARHTVTAEQIHAPNAGANLSESLQRVPGLVALNRQNYAQDLQISSRGFGARSQFGVRGVRLVQDGIPLTMPDGQGQPSLFDLDGLQRIEVIRGPLTTLYGNASGGIIQGFTGEAPFYPTLDNRTVIGSDGLQRSRLRYGGQHGDLNISANVSRLETDGYRDHSDTRRDIANLRLGWDIDDVSSLTLLVNSLDQPDTQDPLGLTKQQVREDRRQAVPAAHDGPGANNFNTRKSVRHNQAGLNYQRRLANDDQLTVMVYGGERTMQQFLGFRGAGPTAGGAVIELDRRFGGGELGWQRSTELFNLPVSLAAGLAYNYQGEERKGFVNANGSKGGLQRDEYNTVDSQEAYLISTWQLAPRWELIAGLRYNRVEFDSDDDYLTDGQDDSGVTRVHRTNPALGLNWSWTPELSLYAALGQGFETPTFQELAYRQDGAGMNPSLKPSLSRNAEVGLKWRSNDTRLDIALFESRIKDEIVTGGSIQIDGNPTTRNFFTNAGRSTRRGVEFSIEQQFDHGISGYLAYTYLQAKYDRFNTVAGDDPVSHAGRHLPGVPRHSFFAELAWQPQDSGFHTAIEAQGMSKRYATDDNQHKASGYAVFNWRGGYQHSMGNITIEPFARLDNLTDREYIGSLIVNGSGARYYEPAPERTWLVGLGLQYQWR